MKNQKFTKEEQAVLDAVQRMTTAFHNHEIEGVMASYESKAVVVFEPKLQVADHSQLRQMFLEAFKINPHFSYSGHEVFISGNIATHFAPWTMTGVAPDGTKITNTGLSVAVLRKQDDGSWLMIQDNPHGQFLMNQ